MTSADPIGRALVVSLGVAGLFISAASAVGGATACRPAWSEMPTPPGANSFYGVAAITQSDVWAVGSHYDGVDDRPTAEHFDGIQWVIVNVPTPGPSGAYLRGVAGVSGTDVWAAGYWITTSGLSNTLIEHYDGISWTIVPSPNPPSSASYLGTVAAVATNDVWVAGHYLDNSGVYRTLVEHWDGTSWMIASSPNAGNGDNALNGIAAASSNDIWAVGYQSSAPGAASSTLVLHFDGTIWTIVPSPNPGGLTSSLAGVVAMADGRIWAAGFYYDGTQGRTLLVHGDSSGDADPLGFARGGETGGRPGREEDGEHRHDRQGHQQHPRHKPHREPLAPLFSLTRRLEGRLGQRRGEIRHQYLALALVAATSMLPASVAR